MQTDEDVDAFIEGIAKTDGQDREEFRRILRGAIEHERLRGLPDGKLRAKLAQKCGVTPATVGRWLDGKGPPGKHARRPICEFIRKYLRAGENEYRAMRDRGIRP